MLAVEVRRGGSREGRTGERKGKEGKAEGEVKGGEVGEDNYGRIN